MRTIVDARLRLEAAAFELCYACERCAHFDPHSGACAEGYPNEGHRNTRVDAAEWLEFCKSFELS